jgi:hypothetical protein
MNEIDAMADRIIGARREPRFGDSPEARGEIGFIPFIQSGE